MSTVEILLAEDNRGDILLIQQSLEMHNIPHTLYVVKDGEEALSFMAEMGKPRAPPCPDVLLLDLNLPKVGGLQVLGKFRQHPECTQTPVIVLTSSDAPKDRSSVAALGVRHYFRKPTDFDAFMQIGAVVREALS